MDNIIKYDKKTKKTIKDLDILNRPREILFEKGVEVLSDEQVLAILIDTGTKEYNAIELASKLLDYVGGLQNLSKADICMIQNIKGIGPAKACKIVASIEIANRISKRKVQKNPVVKSPKDFVDIFAFEFDRQNVEIFKLICLNNKNAIIYSKNLSIGVVDETLITTREIFKEALLRHAVSIVIMHNHPSGDCMPSQEDIDLTSVISKAGDIMNIKLLDHIIYANIDNYYSFSENSHI